VTDDRLAQVNRRIAEILLVDASLVTPDAKLDDLGATSLVKVELVVALEETFGLNVSEAEFARIASVGDLYALVQAGSE
jgi:acyl carrier protein